MLFKSIFKKDDENKLYAPVRGNYIDLVDVHDQVFSQKLLGDGVGFEFDGDTIYSPCKGKVTVIAQTKHAIGIKTNNDIDVLLHVGLDTVNLNGKGFKVLVGKGDTIKPHTPLIKVDREYMNKNGIDMTVVLLVTNKDAFELSVINKEDRSVDLNTEVITWE